MKFGLKGLLLNERRAVPVKMYGQSTGHRTVRRRFSEELSTSTTNVNVSSYLAPPTRDHPIVQTVETYHSRARTPIVFEFVRVVSELSRIRSVA